jgi:hypothetical protein
MAISSAAGFCFSSVRFIALHGFEGMRLGDTRGRTRRTDVGEAKRVLANSLERLFRMLVVEK